MKSTIPFLQNPNIRYILLILAIISLILPYRGILSYAGEVSNTTDPVSWLLPNIHEPFNQLLPPDPNTPSLPYQTIASNNRTLELTHIVPSATVHVLDTYQYPSAGTQRFYLPPLTNNLNMEADGTPLSYTVVKGLDTPNIVVDVVVPSGVVDLEIEYDQTDGSIAFEGSWYLVFDWIWGPVTIIAHLPTDTNIIRYENSGLATLMNSYTLRFDIPSGTPVFTTIVYTTNQVPDHYYTVTTEHFNVHLPLIYSQYATSLTGALEALYLRYTEYMGYDVNQTRGQTHFEFYFPPGGWNWWDTQITLWGGLCIVGGGPCAVSRSVITKMSLLPSTTFWDNAFGYLGHELGHGWQGVVGQGNMPWWINDGEGYPGYLNLHAWTDLGLCPLIEDWYSEAYSYYLEYMADPTTRHDHANLVIATGLREEYGWDWLREIHSAILGGRLNLSGLSEQEKTDQMIAFLSQFLEENLVPYFDQNLIYASQWVRESLAGLPGSDAAVPTQWSCPAGTLGASPTSLSFLVEPGGSVSPSQVFHINNDGDGQITWSISENPPVQWFSISTDSGLATPLYTVPITATIDASNLTVGNYTTTLFITAQAGTGNNPLSVPVYLKVAEYERICLPVVLNNVKNLLPSGLTTLFDGYVYYGESGFSFGTNTVVAWNSSIADLLVAKPDPASSMRFFLPYDAPPYSDGDNAQAGIIGMSQTELVQVAECPESGYQYHWADTSPGGVYCVRTRDGAHYAVIKLTSIDDSRLSFSWIYQPDGSRRFD